MPNPPTVCPRCALTLTGATCGECGLPPTLEPMQPDSEPMPAEPMEERWPDWLDPTWRIPDLPEDAHEAYLAAAEASRAGRLKSAVDSLQRSLSLTAARVSELEAKLERAYERIDRDESAYDLVIAEREVGRKNTALRQIERHPTTQWKVRQIAQTALTDPEPADQGERCESCGSDDPAICKRQENNHRHAGRIWGCCPDPFHDPPAAEGETDG